MNKSEVKIGAALSYIIIILNTLIGVFFTPFLTRMLGQSEYGLYSLIASIISYITILDFGFGNAITVYASKYIAKKDNAGLNKLNGMFLIIYTIIGLVAAILGVALTLNIELLFSKTMSVEEIFTAKILMGILTFNVAVTFPFSIFANIITAYEKFIFSKTLNIIRVLALPACMIPLLLSGYKSISLAILTTVINCGVLLANTVYCIKKIHLKFLFNKFNKPLLVEITGYSFFIFLNQISDKIHFALNNFILGAIVGTLAVAVYNVSLQFINMYLAFSTAISSVMLPKISKMEAKNASDKEFTEIFIKTGRIQYIIMGLIVTGFIIFGKDFIVLLFGADYEEAYIIICILMIPITIPLIQNVGLSIMQAKNKFKFRAILSFATAIVSAIISAILSKQYGGIGAAIGTSFSWIVGNFLILNIYYHKIIKLNIFKFWIEILKISLPILIIFIPCLLAISYFGYNGLLAYLLEIIAYTILYCLVQWCFTMTKDEKDLILRPIKSMFNKFV